MRGWRRGMPERAIDPPDEDGLTRQGYRRDDDDFPEPDIDERLEWETIEGPQERDCDDE